MLWQEGTGKSQLSWLVTLLDLEGAGEHADYFMPLALAWEERDEERVRNLSTAALAKIRQQANVGVMGDAFADEVFCRSIVASMAARKEIAMSQGKLQFRPTTAFERLAGSDFGSLAVARPRGSSSNTVVAIGERLMLKGYRRLRAGVNPELDMGLYLTEVVHYPNCAPLAGVLEYIGERRRDAAAGACCKATSPIRAMAGPTRSSTCSVISNSIAPRPPAMPCPPTRMSRTWR